MHATAILFAGAAFAAAATPAQAPAPRMDPTTGEACRDIISQVRAEAGRPRLERGVARPGEARAWLAVDRRYDGCRVLVPASDPRDIRPEPAAPEGPVGFLPAR
ncbi:MAG TPA: hypothetical protein VM055_04625 [Novosphingobium sp.]|nr:hypothetical protein [Novosphingobium sp.]